MVTVIVFLLGSCTATMTENGIDDSAREDKFFSELKVDEEKIKQFKNLKVPERELSEKKSQDKKLTKKKKVGKNEALKRQKIVKGLQKYPHKYPVDLKKMDKKSRGVWQVYDPKYFPGEKASYVLKYMGIICANMEMQVFDNKLVGKKETFHIKTRVKSSPFYKFIYTFDDHVESFIDVKKFLPVKYYLVQNESRKKVWNMELFDENTLQSYIYYKRIKKERNREYKKVVFTPRYFQDPISVFYFLRGLDHKLGKSYTIPIVKRDELLLFKVKVQKYEKLKFINKKFNTVKLMVSTYTRKGEKKKGESYFWISRDPSKALLKFYAKIKIGSVSGVITEYQSGSKTPKT